MADQMDSAAEEILSTETAIAADEAHPIELGASGPTVVRSALWTIAGFGVINIMRFAFNPIVYGLCEKSAVGVIGLANMFLTGLHMFSDLGIRQCVVKSTRGDEPEFLRTAWTIQVIRGLLLFAIMVAVCWPLGWLYKVPEFYWLLPIIGLAPIVDGFNSVGVMSLLRQMRRDLLVIREIAAYGVSMAFVITTLVLLHQYVDDLTVRIPLQMFAFVLGSVLAAVVEMILGYRLASGTSNRFGWDKPASRELLHFGGWIFISTACTYLAANFDRLVLGNVSMDGFVDYNLAANLARTPTVLISTVAHLVLFPLYSRFVQSQQPLGEVFSLLHSAMNGAAAYLIAGALASCPTLIPILFDARYENAAFYVGGLVLAAWFTVLQSSSEVLLLAQGNARQVAIGQVVKLICLGPLLYVGYHYQGILGFIGGYILAEATRYFVLCFSLTRAGYPVWRIDLMLSALVVISAKATMLIGPRVAQVGDGRWWLAGRLGVEILVMSLIWGFFALVWWPKHGRRLIDLMWLGR